MLNNASLLTDLDNGSIINVTTLKLSLLEQVDMYTHLHVVLFEKPVVALLNQLETLLIISIYRTKKLSMVICLNTLTLLGTLAQGLQISNTHS